MQFASTLQNALDTILGRQGSKRPCEDSGLAGADPAAASLAALLDGAEPTALETLFDQQPSATKRRKCMAQLEVAAESSVLERQRALYDAADAWSSSSSQMESSYASGGESESGSDSSGPGIHLPAEGSKLRDAFFVSLQSTTVLAALVATEQHHGGQCRVLIDRPFCPDGRSNLETMLGAMFCLLRRGNWGADELTPELLVTALWVVQSWEDSQWQWASWTANAYAKRDPIAKGDPAPLQEAMLVLQMEVLTRCGWSCRRTACELHAAIQELSGSPEFDATCTYVLSEARRVKNGFIQARVITYSTPAALSLAATPASLGSAIGQCRSVPGRPKHVTPRRPKVAGMGTVTRAMSRAMVSEQ